MRYDDCEYEGLTFPPEPAIDPLNVERWGQAAVSQFGTEDGIREPLFTSRAQHFLRWTGCWERMHRLERENRPRTTALYVARERPHWLTAWAMTTDYGEIDGV